MKLKFNKEKKTVDVDVDAEKLVEKGMDLHEKDWKEKFNTKHEAKKEIMELRHKHNIENKEQDLKGKSSIIHDVFSGFKNKKQLELEEQRKREEEARRLEEERIRLEEERLRREREEKERNKKEKRTISIFILIISLLMTIIGFGFGKPESGLEMIGFIGFIGCIVGLVLLFKN